MQNTGPKVWVLDTITDQVVHLLSIYIITPTDILSVIQNNVRKSPFYLLSVERVNSLVLNHNNVWKSPFYRFSVDLPQFNQINSNSHQTKLSTWCFNCIYRLILHLKQ